MGKSLVPEEEKREKSRNLPRSAHNGCQKRESLRGMGMEGRARDKKKSGGNIMHRRVFPFGGQKRTNAEERQREGGKTCRVGHEDQSDQSKRSRQGVLGEEREGGAKGLHLDKFGLAE